MCRILIISLISLDVNGEKNVDVLLCGKLTFNCFRNCISNVTGFLYKQPSKG